MPLGLESGTVRVVSYDPEWPVLFAAETQRIMRLVSAADLPLALEHMGSTAVPGLDAKPIIDILGGYPASALANPAAVADYVRVITFAGYVHRGEQGIPGREYFRQGNPRSYHLHLAVVDGTFWRDHLAFRDRLRARPELRDAYGALKRDLAARFPRDRESYTDGKASFVRRVLEMKT